MCIIAGRSRASGPHRIGVGCAGPSRVGATTVVIESPSVTAGSPTTVVILTGKWEPDPAYWALFAARQAGYCGA